MTTYTHLTRWTMPRDYFGASWPEYYRAGTSQHRDSDALTRSNFACMLVALGGESDTVIVVREGHWAVGWVEWIAIHESDVKALGVADGIMARLAEYPVMDEDHYCQVETDDANDVWKRCYTDAERLVYMREHRADFEFHTWADVRAQARGEYFGGIASELLS